MKKELFVFEGEARGFRPALPPCVCSCRLSSSPFLIIHFTMTLYTNKRWKTSMNPGTQILYCCGDYYIIEITVYKATTSTRSIYYPIEATCANNNEEVSHGYH